MLQLLCVLILFIVWSPDVFTKHFMQVKVKFQVFGLKSLSGIISVTSVVHEFRNSH